MGVQKSPVDAVHWYIQKLTARIVAKSGISTDQFHLGKIIIQCFKDAPDFVLQIDGATGKSETFESVLNRSVMCALSLKNLGLKLGDNIVLMAPNHLDLAIPFYAALYLGLGIGCVDMTLNVGEVEDIFKCEKPKAVFCQREKAMDVANVLRTLNLDAVVITFDNNDKDNFMSFSQFLQKTIEHNIEDFQPTDFDPEETIAFLVATSGTTGLSKAAAITHSNIAIASPYWWLKYDTFPTPTRMTMLTSPIQWFTAIHIILLSPILRFTRLQSSLPMTVEHAYHLINTYKPTDLKISTNLITALINPMQRTNCDFTCFELIMIGGSAVPQSLIDDIKNVNPKVDICIGYGMTEMSGLSLINYHCVPGVCGQLLRCVQVRLINTETSEDIYEPNIPGEMWLKGPTIFKGYINNKDVTKQSFSDDGWLKTGDLFYRDENWNFIFVDRIKMLLKYRSHQISPIEIESVIRKHPSVQAVAVTGIPHPEDGELPVACVVPYSDSLVTEREIRQMVQESLSNSKQLRGGVIFMEELPSTVSSKINRAKLKQIVLDIVSNKMQQ